MSPPSPSRAMAALRAVLPVSVKVKPVPRPLGPKDDFAIEEITVNGTAVRLVWVGEGWPKIVRGVAARRGPRPDIIAARRMSLGARSVAAEAGLGWVDESGAAEISLPGLVVARSGRADDRHDKPAGWTPAVLGVTEALLTGTRPTVASTTAATGLSTSTCSEALKALTELGLLEATVHRGPNSARRVPDPQRLLRAYADAVVFLQPRPELRIGVLWRDPVAGLAAIGRSWDHSKFRWAATGAAAAAVLAPLLTSVETAEVLVEATDTADLERAARRAGAEPMEGGRLLLRPFTTPATARLATVIDGIRIAPWPRVFADLRTIGVRGEEAAEHLEEAMHGQ